jgi:hypothetical protein
MHQYISHFDAFLPQLLRGAYYSLRYPRQVIARSVAVARQSRSKPGDSSLCSEQAPQSQSEIATPFGLAMTVSCGSDCKLFYALGNKIIRTSK